MEGHLISHTKILVERVPEEVYVPNVSAIKYLFYCTDIGWIMDWSNVCLIGLNVLIRVGVTWINVYQVRIFWIPNYTIVMPNFFKIKIIFALNNFDNFLASKVFILNFHCDMPCISPVDNIWWTSDQVKYVAVAQPDPDNLWEWDSDGSQWVYSNFFICVPPKINAQFSPLFQLLKGKSQ